MGDVSVLRRSSSCAFPALTKAILMEILPPASEWIVSARGGVPCGQPAAASPHPPRGGSARRFSFPLTGVAFASVPRAARTGKTATGRGPAARGSLPRGYRTVADGCVFAFHSPFAVRLPGLAAPRGGSASRGTFRRSHESRVGGSGGAAHASRRGDRVRGTARRPRAGGDRAHPHRPGAHRQASARRRHHRDRQSADCRRHAAEGRRAVVTGKGYGTTNLLALDRAGNVLMDSAVQVESERGRDLVVVYRGTERESRSCAPQCERRIM